MIRDPPGYASDYKADGFTILNDANDHSMDFGSASLTQTVQSIHAASLAQTGLPGEITLVSANGVTVASWPSLPTTGPPAWCWPAARTCCGACSSTRAT